MKLTVGINGRSLWIKRYVTKKIRATSHHKKILLCVPIYTFISWNGRQKGKKTSCIATICRFWWKSPIWPILLHCPKNESPNPNEYLTKAQKSVKRWWIFNETCNQMYVWGDFHKITFTILITVPVIWN